MTSVLTGNKGWLQKHAEIVKLQWGDDDEVDDEDDLENRLASMPWRLPRDPPKLLPIVANHYTIGVPPPPPAGRVAAKALAISPRRLAIASRFSSVQTILRYAPYATQPLLSSFRRNVPRPVGE